jgi:hypothetical protein
MAIENRRSDKFAANSAKTTDEAGEASCRARIRAAPALVCL